MKVKNIMFTGFAAAVLAGACGSASAATTYVLASRDYVDTEVGKKVSTTDYEAHVNAQAAIDQKQTTDIENNTEAIALLGGGEDGAGVGQFVADINTLKDQMTGTGDGSVNKRIADAQAAAEAYADGLASNYDAAGSAAAAQAAAEAYADSLAGNYDASGSAAAVEAKLANYETKGAAAAVDAKLADYALKTYAESEADAAEAAAKAYADGLAGNYDAAGSAAAVEAKLADYETKANLESKYALKTYAESEADAAEAAAKAYADGLASNYDAAGSAAAVEAAIEAKGYAVAATVNAELANKQAALDTNQLAAVNSGITADKVAIYDGYKAQIDGKLDDTIEANGMYVVEKTDTGIVYKSISVVNGDGEVVNLQ